VNNKDDSVLLLTSTRETVNVCLKPSRKDSIGYLKGEVYFFKENCISLVALAYITLTLSFNSP
jgi:hypothetical protein